MNRTIIIIIIIIIILITLHCKKTVIIKTRTLVKKAEHGDGTFLMAGKPFY